MGKVGRVRMENRERKGRERNEIIVELYRNGRIRFSFLEIWDIMR
jgi:hypothetical protein